MDLNLDLETSLLPDPPRRIGVVEIVREMREEDLDLLHARPKFEQVEGPKATVLKNITERHHAAAQFVAAGFKNWEVAAATGYSAHYISILRSCPAFQDLVARHKDFKVDQFHKDTFGKLSGMSNLAADILIERMVTTPEKMTTGQLIEITKVGADRTGHGPSSTNVNLNAEMGDIISAGRKRAQERSKLIRKAIEDKTIEGTAVEIKDDAA